MLEVRDGDREDRTRSTANGSHVSRLKPTSKAEMERGGGHTGEPLAYRAIRTRKQRSPPDQGKSGHPELTSGLSEAPQLLA
jgi:hypothetical protein